MQRIARKLANEAVDRAGGLGRTNLDPAARQGAHLNLLPGPHAEMAQELTEQGHLSVGGDGEGGHGPCQGVFDRTDVWGCPQG